MSRRITTGLILALWALLATPAVADKPGDPGFLQFRGSSFPVTEEESTVSVVVKRHRGSTGAVTVEYTTADGSALDGEFSGYGDPGAQAEQAMRNVAQLLGEMGAGVNDICKITTYVSDRAYREPVYKVVGRHLKGVYPAGTGLIVDGFASPRILTEIDVEAVIQN